MGIRAFFTPYGLIQLAAIVIFLALLEARLRRRSASLLGHGWLAAAAVLAAGIGGRLHFVIEQLLSPGAGSIEPAALLSLREGGSTFFGAMAGVVAVLILFRRRVPGQSVLRLADDAVLGFGAAILIGRLGCLVQGCCLGEPTSVAWGLPAGLRGGSDAVRLHPLPLYLGLWGAASAVIAWFLPGVVRARATSRLGTRVFLFAALFSLGRGFLESFRLRPEILIAGAGWARAESFAIAGIAAAVLLFRVVPGSRVAYPAARWKRHREHGRGTPGSPPVRSSGSCSSSQRRSP